MTHAASTGAASTGAFAALLLNLAEEHERAVNEAVSQNAHDLRMQLSALRQEIQELRQGKGNWLECIKCRQQELLHQSRQGNETLSLQVWRLAKEELSEALRKSRRRAQGHETQDCPHPPPPRKVRDPSKFSSMQGGRSAAGAEPESAETPKSAHKRSSLPGSYKRSFTTSALDSKMESVKESSSAAAAAARKAANLQASSTEAEDSEDSEDDSDEVPLPRKTMRKLSVDSLQITRERRARENSCEPPPRRGSGQQAQNNKERSLRRGSQEGTQGNKETRRGSQESTQGGKERALRRGSQEGTQDRKERIARRGSQESLSGKAHKNARRTSQESAKATKDEIAIPTSQESDEVAEEPTARKASMEINRRPNETPVEVMEEDKQTEEEQEKEDTQDLQVEAMDHEVEVEDLPKKSSLRALTPPPIVLRQQVDEKMEEKRNSRLHELRGHLSINTERNSILSKPRSSLTADSESGGPSPQRSRLSSISAATQLTAPSPMRSRISSFQSSNTAGCDEQHRTKVIEEFCMPSPSISFHDAPDWVHGKNGGNEPGSFSLAGLIESESAWDTDPRSNSNPSSPRGAPPALQMSDRTRSLASVAFSDDNESLAGGASKGLSPGFKKPGKRLEDDGIKLHNVWKRGVSFAGSRRADLPQHSKRSDGFLRRSMRRSDTSEAMTAFALQAPWWERTLAKFISHPGSGKRVFWDILGIFLVGQDVVLFPFQVFTKSENLYTSWFTTFYWTASIPMTFFVGFQKGGIIEMRPRRIANHYARSWLSFDVGVVSLDWALSIAGMVGASAAAQGSIGSVRFLKVLRFLRVARLLRLWKVRGVLNDLIDRVQSEAFLILVGIVKLIVMIVLVNHLIACVWYGLGDMIESKDTWVLENFTVVHQDDHWYRYFTSMHWSLTQFTPASMEVVPRNVYERAFAVCVIVFAMVTFSSFISSITNAMTQLRNLNAEHNHQLSVLRQYLTQNSISGSLTVRIWGCVQKAVNKSKKRIHERDVLMMQALPWHLRMDVLEEIYAPLLGKHPFFMEYGTNYSHQVRRIYENAVEEVSLAMGQKLFNAGEVAHSMFFICTGVSCYTRDSVFDNEHPVEVTEQWICEAVLWLKWKHNGQFVAKSHAEFVGVTAGQIHTILKDNRHAIKYARNFAAYFKKYPEYLSDAYYDIDCINDIVKKAFAPEDGDDDVAFGHVMSQTSIKSQKSQKVIQTGSAFPAINRRRHSLGGILNALRIKTEEDDTVDPEAIAAITGEAAAAITNGEEEAPEPQEGEEAVFKERGSVDSNESQMTAGDSDDSEKSSDDGMEDDSDEDNIGSEEVSPIASREICGHVVDGKDDAGNGKPGGTDASLPDIKAFEEDYTALSEATGADSRDATLSILPEVTDTRKVVNMEESYQTLRDSLGSSRDGRDGVKVQKAWS